MKQRLAGRSQAGFSLLEVLVAFAIMAMALALLYRSMGGSASATQRIERQQLAGILAQSVLEMREHLDPLGWNESGTSAGMRWRVSSQLLAGSGDAGVTLHQVQLQITWDDVPGVYELITLKPQRQLVPGEVRP